MDKERAQRIVALWLMAMWAEKPDWLVRMPDRKTIDDLVQRIANG